MRSSKFGYVLLAGVVFAAPACTIETHVSDGAAGSAGAGAGSGGSSGMVGSSGTGGSAGQSGSGGSAGSAETGGASGAAEAGAAGAAEGGTAGAAESGGEAGASGSSSTGTCDTTGFEFPMPDCDTGSLSELTNPTCQDVFLCMGLADCTASHMACGACLDYVKAAFEGTDTCIMSATQAVLTDACKKVAADAADQYPQCMPK